MNDASGIPLQELRLKLIKADWTFQQTVALLEENLFFSFPRAGAWSTTGLGWSSPIPLGFVCPVCCKVWGILAIEERELIFTASPCVRHAGYSPYRVDGSLLYSYSTFEAGNFDVALLDALPPELLRREFELHLNHYEKELA